VEVVKRNISRDAIINFNGSTFLFRKADGSPYTGNFIGKVFRHAIERSGINKHISVHDLRHSYASNLINGGASILAVSRLLGHADIRTTQIYSHLNVDDLRVAVSCLNSGIVS
jgi:integrase/recombinase XerD